MGYYEPDRIRIKGEGVYPSLICHFPRLENTDLDAKLKEEVDKYSREYEAFTRKIGKDKSKKKEMKTVEQYKQEVEKDLDRNNYCKLIEGAI